MQRDRDYTELTAPPPPRLCSFEWWRRVLTSRRTIWIVAVACSLAIARFIFGAPQVCAVTGAFRRIGEGRNQTNFEPSDYRQSEGQARGGPAGVADGHIPSVPRVVKEAPPGYTIVHIIEHTHDDVGWLKTVDQYYKGQAQHIQRAYVELIIDGVLTEVAYDPDRVFTYVEMAFLSRWWKEQKSARRQLLQSMAQQKRFQIANGGWVMHDEACPHFIDMMEQTTLGHQFILKNLKIRPEHGWQIDPFGHSTTHAYLSQLSGLKSTYFARMDYQEKRQRIATQSMEMMQRTVPGLDASFFTMMMFEHYDAPHGFCYDELCHDPYIQDDPSMEGFNADARARVFKGIVEQYQHAYKTRHVLVPFGTDFTHSNAKLQFLQAEKLISYINKNSDSLKMVAVFSSPELYYNSVISEKPEWPVKEFSDDFFPYADSAHSYWTGYFASRSAFKRLVRVGSIALVALEKQLHQLLISTPLRPDQERPFIKAIEDLREILAVSQHHDAVTGTAKQHVSDNYVKHLSAAISEAQKASGGIAAAFASDLVHGSVAGCAYLNISICEPLNTMDEEGVVFFVHNPSHWDLVDPVLLVPSPHRNVTVHRLHYDDNDVQYEHVDIEVNRQPFSKVIDEQMPWRVDVFAPTLPANSWSIFKISQKVGQLVPSRPGRLLLIEEDHKGQGENRKLLDETAPSDSTFSLKVDNFELKFAPSDPHSKSPGVPTSFVTGSGEHPIKHEWGWYASDYGSGAYLFRPSNSGNAVIVAQTPQSTVKSGSCATSTFLSESQKWPMYVQYCLRVETAEDITGSTVKTPYIEVNFRAGPLNVGDRQGKELVSSWIVSDMNTDKTLYHDSNGLIDRKRVLNKRESFDLKVEEQEAGNYFPATSRAYIQDVSSDRRLSIFFDRSVGCASLFNGKLEFMLLRRLLYDDAKGVAEALNERRPPIYKDNQDDGYGIRVTGQFHVYLDSIAHSTRRAASRESRLLYSPQMLFAHSKPDSDEAQVNPALQLTGGTGFQNGPPRATASPPEVQVPFLRLVTGFDDSDSEWSRQESPPRDRAAANANSHCALRNQGHTYLIRLLHTKPMTASIAEATTVNLSELFSTTQSPVNVTAIETTLTGNALLRDVPSARSIVRVDSGAINSMSESVTIAPGELRTFAAFFKRRGADSSSVSKCSDDATHSSNSRSYWHAIGIDATILSSEGRFLSPFRGDGAPQRYEDVRGDFVGVRNRTSEYSIA